ncbi:MAG: HK97 gp10 family phage protein [Eubacteriales bacterium]|nr:HK97 gp10 family phage protein [Eubacteriales bacterium]
MIDVSQLDSFARSCEAAAADLKPYAGEILEDAGEEFLDIVQSAIQSAGNVDKGKLLASFTKGGAGNIWELNTGGLTLTIGTNVEYAKWVNDGHRQQPGRFIPGFWEGNHFRYSPGAKSGMVLKAFFVAGSHFFDKSVQVLERMFPEMAENAFRQFFRRYFP